MNEVNRTLFIPLYGKASVSKQGIILSDKTAERIWAAEAFPIRGKSKSKWLTYNMAMRARVFDDWTEEMLRRRGSALVLHIGCGLDARCLRVSTPYERWLDLDFEDVIRLRRGYFAETDSYRMAALNAADSGQLGALPEAEAAIVVMEGVSMYMTNDQLHTLIRTLGERYAKLNMLMDVYTEFAARASKYKNPVNDVGVTALYGIDEIESVLEGTAVRLVSERSFTPPELVEELKPSERAFFKVMFGEKLYRRLYRLYELSSDM